MQAWLLWPLGTVFGSRESVSKNGIDCSEFYSAKFARIFSFQFCFQFCFLVGKKTHWHWCFILLYMVKSSWGVWSDTDSRLSLLCYCTVCCFKAQFVHHQQKWSGSANAQSIQFVSCHWYRLFIHRCNLLLTMYVLNELKRSHPHHIQQFLSSSQFI